jgi:hypothetical protein
VRETFAAAGNRASEQGSDWWRRFQDHDEASLPRLVREADRRWRRRADGDHAARVRERLARRYAAEVDLRTRLGLPTPPWGRPRRLTTHASGSVRGKRLADHPDLLAEWAWDANAELDPAHLAAGSHERVVWRCLLEPAHVWESRLSDRTSAGSGCPLPHGHPRPPRRIAGGPLPWLAHEWHPTRNMLRPDQVTRASARLVAWRCKLGHEWTAAVYQRTLSHSGCPECYRAEAAQRSRAGRERARFSRAGASDQRRAS